MGCNQSTHDGPSEIAHFDSQAQEPIEIPVKLLLLGDSGVGKSSLMIRQCDQEFNFNTLSTVGIDFKEQRIEINEKQIKLQIWDTAGQERFRTITKSYYRGAQGYILVYDITSRMSFEHIKYWLNEVKKHGREDFYTILVGNKIDLELDRVVSTDEGQKFASSNGIDFIETSAKEGTRVNDLFITGIKGHLKNNPIYKDVIKNN
eukprot:TRINITY_DN3161_c3_g1_i1.p1 TRINITY_DN3161_c3_g1~~TRINITY_DN3161_c3_g1_i1.p1  ORF type:complete len:204 (+),score=33.38 TRINITY_DN3161_c3_g1_i1:16-627(+)